MATGLEKAATGVIRKWVEVLVAQTRAHVIERANQKLHTRRQMFVENLTHFQESEDTWVISLDASVRWIDDGMSQFSMIDGLLKSPKAKMAKDGSKYLCVPFEHGPKGLTQMTQAQATLLDTIKSELKGRGIPYAKIEKDESGAAKTGLLHSFDINDQPIKTWDGHGQGAGPIGQVMQGPTGIPILKGIRIYQKQTKNESGATKIKRQIMTFRVVSSKHKEQGRWEYPGIEGVHLMEDGYQWAQDEWDREMVPKIMDEIVSSL